MNIANYCLQNTSFGPVAIVWSFFKDRPMILRVLLSKPERSAKETIATAYPDYILNSCPEIDQVANNIDAFTAGDDIRFSLDLARLDLCSKFQQKVLITEHAIPRGHVSTYQRIARYVGNSKASRAVGTALATNPFPIIIPCHRAIRTDRTLGGFQGGLAMKRKMLEMEGIEFDGKDRVIKTACLFY